MDPWLILELLARAGWTVYVMAPFAGVVDADGTPGVLVVAAHPNLSFPINIVGPSVAHCAPLLLVEAMSHREATRAAA